MNINWSTTIGTFFSFLNHVSGQKDLDKLSNKGWGREDSKHLSLTCIPCHKVTYLLFMRLIQSTSSVTLTDVTSSISQAVSIKVFLSFWVPSQSLPATILLLHALFPTSETPFNPGAEQEPDTLCASQLYYMGIHPFQSRVILPAGNTWPKEKKQLVCRNHMALPEAIAKRNHGVFWEIKRKKIGN